MKISRISLTHDNERALFSVKKAPAKSSQNLRNRSHILYRKSIILRPMRFGLQHSIFTFDGEGGQIFKTLMARARSAEEECSPHFFRHTRLWNLALKGASEAVLMDWAGWTDSRPASAYIKATGRLAQQYADEID